ncbi:hypothetical protein PENSPDRAFT_337584 [Peniophora sp. CONT]|nr:hypothetical protein PENSPDRAFT_337584 [Peniophora sp. CONT]
MSCKTLLLAILRHFHAVIRALRHWGARAGLRLFLSILRKRVSPRGYPDHVPPTSIDTGPALGHSVEVSCSVVPFSASASHASLHMADVVQAILPASRSGSRTSSRAPSIRSARSYQSAFDGEELRQRARMIAAEQAESGIRSRAPLPGPSIRSIRSYSSVFDDEGRPRRRRRRASEISGEQTGSGNRAPSPAPSIRSTRSYQSVYDDEVTAHRARAISTEHRGAHLVIRQWSRVAVTSPRSRSFSRPPSVRGSRSISPTPAHSSDPVHQPLPPDDGRPYTPTSLHVPQDLRTWPLGEPEGFDRPTTPEHLVESPASTRAPPLMITTIDVQPPSPTAPSTSQPVRPHSPPSNPYQVQSQPFFDNTAWAVYPDLPTPPPHRFLICITPEDLLRYHRRATTAKKEMNHVLRPLTTMFPQ